MPRKNNTRPHQPLRIRTNTPTKRRFATKRQAEQAAEERMLLTPNLTLSVYRELDGGWYLTSSKK